MYFFIFHLPTNNYPGFLTTLIDRANANTSYIGRQSSSGSLSFQSRSVSCSSGWRNLLPRGCHLIIGQYETMARRILQTNIDLLILLSPPESLHRYGRTINATDATSKLPWIFYSSISFSHSNKLLQSCKLTPSYHTSHVFSPFHHSNLAQHIVFFY